MYEQAFQAQQYTYRYDHETAYKAHYNNSYTFNKPQEQTFQEYKKRKRKENDYEEKSNKRIKIESLHHSYT